MKKHFSLILLAVGALLLPSCMDNVDDPNTDDYLITSPVSVGEVNATILDVKTKFCASSAGAEYVRNQSNFFSKVKEDLVIEGVVVANDVSGNLYQTLLIRNIDETAGTDQCIQVAIQNTCLYPFFPLGQRIRVNVTGLYAGCYSKVPKIGEPYITSNGNEALGPMKMPVCKQNVQLIGLPNPNAPELIPVDYTAGNVSLPTQNYKNSPMFAKVRGVIKEVQGNNKDKQDVGELSGEKEPLPKIYAPECLYDAGYGVDRTIKLTGSSKTVTIRTSTQNEVAYTVIPEDERIYTGMFTYYSGWQIVVRDLKDIENIAE